MALDKHVAKTAKKAVAFFEEHEEAKMRQGFSHSKLEWEIAYEGMVIEL